VLHLPRREVREERAEGPVAALDHEARQILVPGSGLALDRERVRIQRHR
jgi:hypothetical protein